jgi:hypothetical protein
VKLKVKIPKKAFSWIFSNRNRTATDGDYLFHAFSNASSLTTITLTATYRHNDNRIKEFGAECLQVYHALARNDPHPPSPSLLLTGRDGVVYINRHLAVAIGSISLHRMAPMERQP